MPSSRKRQGHHYQKPAAIPSKQRTDGRTFWAILIGIFGLFIAYFAAGNNAIALAIGALLGAVAGYYIGKSMEKDTAHR
jgi:divalent metal cation (Fe/Co/Zn/Cd) transporter